MHTPQRSDSESLRNLWGVAWQHPGGRKYDCRTSASVYFPRARSATQVSVDDGLLVELVLFASALARRFLGTQMIE